jgi:hypothetical protein
VSRPARHLGDRTGLTGSAVEPVEA